MDEVKLPAPFTSYKYLPVTMQSCYVTLEGRINYKAAFHLMPIDQCWKNGKLIRNPKPGSITYTIDQHGNCRGYGKGGKSLDNCTETTVHTTTDNVSVKIHPETMHFSGVKSNHMAMEAAVHTLNAIFYAQDMIDWYKANKNDAEECFKWLVANIITDSSGYLSFIKDIEGFNEKQSDFITYFANMLPDYTDVNVFVSLIESFKQIDMIILPYTKPIRLISINVNHNYKLYTQVVLSKLAMEFSNLEGYVVSYHNDIDIGVKIQIPYEHLLDDDIKQCIKRKSGCHTLTVYRSGAVTHSGPHQLLNEIAYNKFIPDFISVRDKVRTDGPIKLKLCSPEMIESNNNRLVKQYGRNRTDPFAVKVLEEFKLRSLNIQNNTILINLAAGEESD